jgi:hypothetical protein
MEIFNEIVETDTHIVELSVFKNYGDQLVEYGVPPIFEGFWGYITVKNKDGNLVLGYPITNNEGVIKVFSKFSDALDYIRERTNDW